MTSAAFINGGSQTLTGGGESLLDRPAGCKAWDVKSGNQSPAWKAADDRLVGRRSSDGKTLITSGYDGKIILWNVAERKPQQTIEKKGWIRRVALSPDGKNLPRPWKTAASAV